MTDQPGADFRYHDDLLKHWVRTQGWLPAAKRRKDRLKAISARRLRYFTFCAAEAVDVLMLDIARVVVRHAKRGFDTVCFFNIDPEDVARTQRTLPGAEGWAQDFVDVILEEDPYEGRQPPNLEDEVAELENTGVVRAMVNRRRIRREFRSQFPFDILNLDLYQHLKRPKERVPGRLVNTIRRLFEWQKESLFHEGRREYLQEFTLMLTVRIGPQNMGPDHLGDLAAVLRENLESRPELVPIFENRTGCGAVDELVERDFDTFFRLSVPKMIARLALEADWFLDPETGVRVFEFERQARGEPYRMLHLIMDVRRQDPPKDQRPVAPLYTAEASGSYETVVEGIFRDPVTEVTPELVDAEELNESLRLIEARRNLYRARVE